MDRKSRHKIAQSEKLLSAALQERDERLKKLLREAPTHARRHATAVAAIVLSGEDAPDFVEVGEAGIAMDHAMRRQRRVQFVG